MSTNSDGIAQFLLGIPTGRAIQCCKWKIPTATKVVGDNVLKEILHVEFHRVLLNTVQLYLVMGCHHFVDIIINLHYGRCSLGSMLSLKQLNLRHKYIVEVLTGHIKCH